MARITDPQHFDADGNPVVLPGQRIGTLFGEDAETATHTVGRDIPLPLGSLVIGVQPVQTPDGVREIRHVFQVYDIRYASEGRGEFLQMQARGQDIYQQLSVHSDEAQGHLAGLEDTLDEMMYSVATAYKLGYIDLAGNFHERSYMPPVNIEVRMPTEEDLRVLEPHLGELKIGNVLIGKTPSSITTGFFHKYLPMHTLCVATTGWGKTFFLMVAVHQMARCGRYGGIIFDGQGDIMQKLMDSPLARDKYRFFSNDPQYRGNPQVRRWKVSANRVTASHIADAFAVSDAQSIALPLLRSAFYHLRTVLLEDTESYERYLRDAGENGDTFGLGWSWLTWVDESSNKTIRNCQLVPALRGINEMTIDAIKNKFAALCQFKMLSDNDQECMLQQFYDEMAAGRICIVDTTELQDRETRLLVAMVGSKMMREQEEKRKTTPIEAFERQPTLVLFLDEAHEHLSEDPTGRSSECTRIAKTGRKYKVTLFACTQQPSDINRRVRSQFNNLVIGPQPLDLDREASISMASDPLKHLSHLLQVGARGEGILSAAGLPFAVPIKVLNYDNLVEATMQELGPVQGVQTRTRRQTEGFAG